MRSLLFAVLILALLSPQFFAKKNAYDNQYLSDKQYLDGLTLPDGITLPEPLWDSSQNEYTSQQNRTVLDNIYRSRSQTQPVELDPELEAQLNKIKNYQKQAQQSAEEDAAANAADAAQRDALLKQFEGTPILAQNQKYPKKQETLFTEQKANSLRKKVSKHSSQQSV